MDYVGRDLKGRRGELFAAEDADSPLPDDLERHAEGAFYVWRQSELDEVLSDRARLFSAAYGAKPEGNARPESDPHGELRGTNTLFRAQDAEELSQTFGMSLEAVEDALQACRQGLFEARCCRPRPHLDDKAIVSWNALMISGACRVYQVCGYEEARDLAIGAGEFVFAEMLDSKSGALHRAFREIRGGALAFAEDYAAMTNACVDLYECDFDPRWLERAKSLVAQLRERFEDPERGGFFATEASDSAVIARLRDDYDGAEPSANSLAALALIRLAALLDDGELLEVARRTIESFGAQWTRAPRAMPMMLVAASRFLEADQQIVIVGDREAEETRKLVRIANRRRQPHSVMIALQVDEPLPALLAANAKLKAMLEGAAEKSPIAYVCEDYSCREPVSTGVALEALLTE